MTTKPRSLPLRCFHPHCPTGNGLPSWTDVANHRTVKLAAKEKLAFVGHMTRHFSAPPAMPPSARPAPPISGAALERLLNAAPCLFNQLDERTYPRAVVHFCELTLNAPIDASNVAAAYKIQHPSKGPPFSPGPLVPSTSAGAVMEQLCSEVLENEGIPLMLNDQDGWPIWKMPGHVSLNVGQPHRWKALGDILVPCAPTNLVISVKTEAARERLLYSSNSIEGVGFGFFDNPSEFWTPRRMTLLKRMGFSAVYMPDDTYHAVQHHLQLHGTTVHDINISGRPLYRGLSTFGVDMRRVVGRSSDDL